MSKQETKITKKEQREIRHKEKVDRKLQQTKKTTGRRVLLWSIIIIGIIIVTLGIIKFATEKHQLIFLLQAKTGLSGIMNHQ